jgi:hypothetical protein
MGANQPVRNPAKCLTPCPLNVPAMAGQWQQQCRRVAVEMTRKPTCLAPDLAAQCPRRKLARQLAIRPRNGHETTNATSHKQHVGFLVVSFNQDIQNYEHTNHTNARS